MSKLDPEISSTMLTLWGLGALCGLIGLIFVCFQLVLAMERSSLVFWVWRFPIYESRVSLPFHPHGHMVTAEDIKGACFLALLGH